MTERTIFLKALETTDPSGRCVYLDEACGKDTHLRRQVEALLAAHARDGQFLDVAAFDQLKLAAGAGPDGTHASSDAKDADLTFLSPGDKSGVLGRLGHYEVLEIAGRGGMGLVLRAHDEKLRRIVAIKALFPHLATSGSARQRFVREAQAAASVVHDNVIAIHAVEDRGPVPYLVMQFIEGRTLQDKLDHSGPPALKEILRIGLQMALGLAAAHKQGLIHRDVKPANILLENGVERVKITDFGLARAADDAHLTQSGTIAGTPLYMSPEQAEGKIVDQRSDLFSLGSVLYALCTGHAPFRAGSSLAVLKRICEDTPPSIRAANPEIPDWLEAIVARLQVKDPDQRYQTAAEVADVLGQHLAYVQQPDRGVRPKTKTPTAGRRPKRVLAVSAALLATAAVAGFFAFWRQPSKQQDDPTPLTAGPRTQQELDRLPSAFDGRQHLSSLTGGSAHTAPEVIAILSGHRFRIPEATVAPPACSPDGKLLAIGSGRQILVFDIKTGGLRRAFNHHDQRPGSIAFSPDGGQLLAGCWDGTARLFNVESGALIRTYKGHAGAVLNAIFGLNNETVITGSIDGTVRVTTAALGELVFRLPHTHHVHALAVSPDGRYLISGCNDRLVRVWDLADGSLKHTLAGHLSAVDMVQFSPDGKLLGSGSNSEIKLWNAATFEEVRTLGEARAGWFQFAPDGASIVCGSNYFAPLKRHTAARWDVKTGRKLGELTLDAEEGWAVFALTRDGKTLFHSRTEPVDSRLRAYDSTTGKDVFPQRGHTGKVLAVAVSPDGRTLASSGADHAVRLWDLAGWTAAEGEPSSRALTGHTNTVSSLVFSPDGKLLATGGADRMIIVYDVGTGKEVQTLPGPSEPRALVQFSPNGQTLAVGGEEGIIRLWDVATGNAKDSLHGHVGRVRTIAFSPDGRLLASGGEDNTLQTYEVASGRRVHTTRSRTPVLDAVFTPDGRRLAAESCSEHVLRLWDADSNKELAAQPHPIHLNSLAMHPAGSMLAAGMQDGSVGFWGLDSGLALKRSIVVGDRGGPVHGVAFTPEGRYLAAAQENGTVSIVRVPAPPEPYQVAAPRKLTSLKQAPSDALKRVDIPLDMLTQAGRGDPARAPAALVAVLGDARLRHEAAACAVRFIDGDKTLVSLGRDQTVRFWDVATGKQQRAVTINNMGNFSGCALSPDGKVLALGYDVTGLVKLWDLETGKEGRQLVNAADRGVLWPGMAFSPDGTKLATGGRWYWCKIWDVASGKELHKLERRNCNMYAFAFARDGERLAVGYEDPVAVIWDVKEARSLHDFAAKGAIRSIIFSSDGKSLATGDHLGTAKLWDLDTGKERAVFPGHTLPILGVALTPDGKILATASEDHLIKLWDATSGVLRVALPRQRGIVRALALSSDGKTLASASDDGSIGLWDMATGAARFAARGHSAPVNAIAVSSNGATAVTAGNDHLLVVWNLANGHMVRTLQGHTARVTAVALDQNGSRAASVSDDHTLRLWDVATGKVLHVVAELPARCTAVALSPDAGNVAVASLDGFVRLFDVASGRLLREHAHEGAEAWAVAFSPDGRFLASGGDKTVRLWNAATGWEIAVLRGHNSPVRRVAFRPDGRMLASADAGNALQTWDLATLQPVQTLPGPTGASAHLVWSGDGSFLCLLGDKGAQFWRADAKNPALLQAVPLLAAPGCLACTPEGRHVLAAAADGTVHVLRRADQGQQP